MARALIIIGLAIAVLCWVPIFLFEYVNTDPHANPLGLGLLGVFGSPLGLIIAGIGAAISLLGRRSRQHSPQPPDKQGAPVMRSFFVATVALVSSLSATGSAQPGENKFAVRLLNKSNEVRYEAGGKLTLKLELTLTLDQEFQLKPTDLRLAFLDTQLRQLEGLSVVLPEDWKQKAFKKGENRETLMVQFPAPGELDVGREYYVVVILQDQLRFVKFKVAK